MLLTWLWALALGWIAVAILATAALLGVLAIYAATRAPPSRSPVRAVIGFLIGFLIIDTVISVVYVLLLWTPVFNWLISYIINR